MHPLVEDFSKLKDPELESKISDLTKKYFQAHNTGVKAQIATLLEDYRAELARRQQATWAKMMENRDKSLDKLININ
jgi:hypothetical protein